MLPGSASIFWGKEDVEGASGIGIGTDIRLANRNRSRRCYYLFFLSLSNEATNGYKDGGKNDCD